MIQDYFKLALKNLKKRKLRSMLTLVGIVVSIAIIFILVSLSLGLQAAIQEQFESLGGDKFFIQPLGNFGPGTSSPRVLTTEDLNAIEKVSGVKEASYMVAGNAKVEFDNQIKYLPVYGIPKDGMDLYLESGSLKIDEGKITSEDKKLLLGYSFKNSKVYDKSVGARDKLLINDVEFRVEGIFQSVGNPQDDKNVIMNSDDFKALFNSGNRVDYIIIQIQPNEDIKKVAADVQRRLDKFRDVNDKTRDYMILTPEELMKSFTNILNIITFFLVGVAGISLIVGAVGIANTMYTSVLERTREIGIMKAIGARNSDILLIFLIESGLIGMIGGILGVLSGLGISKLVEFIAVTQINTTLLRAATPAYLIFGCIGFAFIIGALSGVFPARHASNIKTVDALRYE